MLDAILLLVWMQPLKAMWSNERTSFLPPIIAGLTIVMLICGSLLFLETEDWSEGLQPFPGERIRTEIEAPGFLLINQEGKPISLDDFRGQVVVITAVYAACSLACPQIIIQARDLIEELSPDEQAKLTFMALSLDPEHENRELMSEFAHYYGADTGRFHFLNGDPEEIYSLLKRFQFARVKNPERGIIEHANLFILIDREGKIAYRLTLTDRHKAWMVAALRSLLSEASDKKT
jgi:cytochrome oxidase Cu insertion factor (SCO1/SenC/PrrC family)